MKHPARTDKNIRRICLLITAVLLAALILPGFYCGLTVRQYTVEAADITAPVRLAVITDLHSCKYGENGEQLVREIRKYAPDALLIVGDFFADDGSNTYTEHILAALAPHYPLYYVTGNHEYWSGETAFDQSMRILEQYGVKRLQNEAITVAINGQTFCIAGVDDPASAPLYASAAQQADLFRSNLSRALSEAPQNSFTLLLSHRPEYFDDYAQSRADLVICGHAHGGQWRIPGILNGFFAPDQGFFPRYAGGDYHRDGTTMIVSRGLARESTRIPRFYNPPELVIIDLV